MPSRSKFGKVNLTGRSKIMRRDFTLKVDWSGSAPKIKITSCLTDFIHLGQ